MLEVLAFIILTITWFLLPAFDFLKIFEVSAKSEMSIDNADDQVDESTPIFIDKDLLPSNKKCYAYSEQPCEFQKEYIIDGTPFEEEERFATEQFRHFEVYANCMEMDGFNNSGLSINDDACLQIYTQSVPNGVIVNANVYLTHAQWHTLVSVSENTFSCTVCGVCPVGIKHIQTDGHKQNMDKYRPLEKYDLSVTRKIDNYYHCAVCNIVFHQSQTEEHYSGKQHEGRMLFAVNKVSDIMYDLSLHDNNNVEVKDTYHYNARAINNMNNMDDINDSSSESNDEYTNYDKLYGVQYSDEDDENFYDNVEPPLSLEHSYASMARKPKTDELPDVLEIDLGSKKVTVKFDSWHMVISPKPNRFYCMVCTQFDHVRRKAEHCRSQGHATRLEQCRVIEMYEKYLVRQVDERLYHCGHCNNLQLINEMEDHIETQHPSRSNQDSPATPRPSTPRPSTPLKPKPGNTAVRNISDSLRTSETLNNTDVFKNASENLKSKLETVQHLERPSASSEVKIDMSVGSSNFSMYHDLRSANSNIDGDIVICAFGFKLSISKLAFNMVCGKNGEYYCGLCEVGVLKANLKLHVNDMQHLILLQRTPFIEAFNIHFYRQIRGALHCALCNELIQLVPDTICRHKIEPNHLINLGKALKNYKDNFTTPVDKPTNTASMVNSSTSSNNAPNKIATPTKVKNAKVIPSIEEIAPVKNPVYVRPAPNKLEETTEFIDVRNGVNFLDDSSADNSSDSLDVPFDFEEYLYVKLGNSFLKITSCSYNTLVDIGDGTKHCFVCSVVVSDLKRHVDSRSHADNMEKYKFVDKYKEDLLRQIYLTYHCSICNVIITRKQLHHHLAWPTHALLAEYARANAKQRRNDMKTGVREIAALTQKESIYLNESEAKIKIVLNISVQKEYAISVVKKNKIVIFGDSVLKISFESWHGVAPSADGWRCKICQTDFASQQFASHVTSDWHKRGLEKIEKQYAPALIRKINDSTLNCIICNTEVSNNHNIIFQHIHGKKHLKNHDAILKESSVANSYADCDEDVVTL